MSLRIVPECDRCRRVSVGCASEGFPGARQNAADRGWSRGPQTGLDYCPECTERMRGEEKVGPPGFTPPRLLDVSHINSHPGKVTMPSPPDPTDADALRVLSDQLEERGLDAGAALLRDVAGRLERSVRLVGPVVEHLSGDLLVTKFRQDRDARSDIPFCGYRTSLVTCSFSIEAAPVGIWIEHEAKP